MPPSTFVVTLDRIESIVAAGREDVFDVQIDRTESFIASGLVSHNTRWNEDDLCGRLLQRATESPLADKWMVIRLAAIRDGESLAYDHRKHGEPLWPSRHPMSSVLATKATIDIYEWNSSYQQLPTPRGGAMFAERHFHPCETYQRFNKWFFKSDGKSYLFDRCAWFQTVDTAMTVSSAADYTVIGTFALMPNGRLVVWHVFRGRVEMSDQFGVAMRLRSGQPAEWDQFGGDYQSWSASSVTPWPFRLLATFVEPKVSGIGLIRQLHAKGVPVRALDCDGEKVRRAGPVATMWSTGLVSFNPAGKPTWVPEFVSEVTRFPGAAKDDQTDVLGYAGQVALYDELIRANAIGLSGEAEAKSEKVAAAGGATIEIDEDWPEM